MNTVFVYCPFCEDSNVEIDILGDWCKCGVYLDAGFISEIRVREEVFA